MNRIVFLTAIALLLGGCVSAGKYKSAVEETQALQGKVTAYESELSALRASCSAKAQESAAKIEGLQKQVQDLGGQVAALEKSGAALEKEQKDRLKKLSMKDLGLEVLLSLSSAYLIIEIEL